MSTQYFIKILISELSYGCEANQAKAAKILLSKGESIIAPLIIAVQDKNNDHWMWIALILIELGSSVVSPLVELLNDKPDFVRYRVIKILSEINDNRAWDKLQQLLGSSNLVIADAALQAMIKIQVHSVRSLFTQ